MREICFRAKTIPEDEWDNGEWVYGYYACFNGEHHRIYTGAADTDCGDYYPDWWEVAPETIGQYTGMTDKNGEKIFEGDIVAVAGEDKPFSVEWDKNLACFLIVLDDYFTTFDNYYNTELEVIGNIYDNA